MWAVHDWQPAGACGMQSRGLPRPYAVKGSMSPIVRGGISPMKKPRMTWIVGALVALSLAAAPAASAASKTGHIVAAKRYQVTQITDGDVVLLPVHVSQARASRHEIPVTIDESRQFLLPDGDGQRQFLLPDGDGQRQFLLPDGDGHRQFLLPDGD